MPFTFAHPAIALPLMKYKPNWLHLGAFILGTMAPDYEYFIWLRPFSTIGHTPVGFVLLNLPIVVILYMLWMGGVGRTLIRHCPEAISSRVMPLFKQEKTKQKSFYKLCFVISALLGMVTHVVWDAFTHETGYAVLHISALNLQVFGVKWYKILQHGSTVLGLTLMAFCFKKLKPSYVDEVDGANKINYWMSVVVLSIPFGGVLLKLANHVGIGTVVVVSIDALLLSIGMMALLWRNDPTLK